MTPNQLRAEVGNHFPGAKWEAPFAREYSVAIEGTFGGRPIFCRFQRVYGVSRYVEIGKGACVLGGSGAAWSEAIADLIAQTDAAADTVDTARAFVAAAKEVTQ